MPMLISLSSRFTQSLLCRQATFKYGGSNKSQWHTQLHRIDNRPFARSFLSGSIQNLINQIAACLIFMFQYISRNFNQVTAKFPFIPICKDGRHLLIVEAQQLLHDPISLTYQLHVTILNTVVNHLHKMSRASRSYPFTTRCAVGSLCSNALQDRFY